MSHRLNCSRLSFHTLIQELVDFALAVPLRNFRTLTFKFLSCYCFSLPLLMWSPVVTWLSPRENDTFGSWDTLSVKWSSREVLDSPAFRLCIPPDDSLRTPFLPGQNQMEEAYNCGSKISPTVEESDGSFLASL